MNQIQHHQPSSNNQKQHQFSGTRQQKSTFQKRKYNDANQQQQQQRTPFNFNKQKPFNEKGSYYFGGGGDIQQARPSSSFQINESQLFDATSFNFISPMQMNQHQHPFYYQPNNNNINQFGAAANNNFSSFGGGVGEANDGDDYREPVYYGYDENTGMFGCFNNNNNNNNGMMNQQKTNFTDNNNFGTTYFNNSK